MIQPQVSLGPNLLRLDVSAGNQGGAMKAKKAPFTFLILKQAFYVTLFATDLVPTLSFYFLTL